MDLVNLTNSADDVIVLNSIWNVKCRDSRTSATLQNHHVVQQNWAGEVQGAPHG